MNNLLAEISRACRDHGIAITRFGRSAVNDPRFVLGLRNGRTPRPETEARVRQFIAKLREA